jgi:peptide/nickel transport system substrate-binding protein
MNRFLTLSLVLTAAACGDKARNAGGEPGGTLVISTTSDPGTLFPPLGVTGQAKQITEQIYDYLAEIGPDLNVQDEKTFRPALADRWRWLSDSLMLAFHINPAAKWHDGRHVTARDVQFTFALNKSPALGGRLSTELANIDSVTVTDSLTAVFWFHERLPTRFIDAAAQMLILPAHQLEKIPVDSLRETAPLPIGTGRFRLRKWNRGSSVEIVADISNYRGRAKLDRVIWIVAPEFPAAVTRLFSGEADLFDALRAENLPELARHRDLKTIILPGIDYAFLRFNLRAPANNKLSHPLFGDRDLRRAITMSLNRSTMVRSVLDTFALVPVGPVVRAYPTTDARGSQLPFDSVRASRLLDSIGWVRRGTDGIRAKNGKELAFNLIIPFSSMNRVRMGPLIQEQLRRMGIRVQLEILEFATEADRESRGAFDAALGAWVMGSSPNGIKGAWTTAGVGKNGVNYGSYSNPRFDALLDSALSSGPNEARDKFTAAYTVINEDAPAIWLYESRRIIGIHRRFQPARMRPDAWWAGLADWSIPPSERIARDRLPIGR